VVFSSAQFDYLNPVYDQNNLYNANLTSDKLIFERHYSGGSDILSSDYDFYSHSTPVVICSNNALNIDPSFSNNMVTWRSNVRNGLWDIWYSVFNGSVWTAPAIVDSTSSDELDNSLYYYSSQNAFFLTSQLNNDIHLRYFKNGIWSADTNLTYSVSPPCSYPNIYTSYTPGSMSSYYISNSQCWIQNIVLSGSALGISVPSLVNTGVSPTDLYITGLNINSRQGLVFEHDTLNYSDVYGKSFSPNIQSQNLSSGYPGRNSWYRGTIFISYCINSYIHRSADSTYVMLTSNTPSVYKKVYLGDSSITTHLNVSRSVKNPLEYFKIRVLWEEKINGKYALKESWFSDALDLINEHNSILNNSYDLSQNYPNPFNPSTKITYNITKPGLINLSVYDISGKLIKILVNKSQSSGIHSLEFTGNNLPSGIYYYTLKVNGTTIAERKMALIK
jgi:hypothetical protein